MMRCLLGAAIGATLLASVRADSTPEDIQGSLDAWCNSSCHPTHCDGPAKPMLARRANPDNDFRCYAQHSLKSDNRTWTGEDHCYCSRNDQIKAFILNNMPSKCQAMMTSYCNSSCYPKLKNRFECRGGYPMIPSDSGPGAAKLRCYSPDAVDKNGNWITYGCGDWVDCSSCYCSRDDELWDIVEDCLLGLTRARVFAQNIPDQVCYRVPAVVQTANGTLVAFAEARFNGCDENDAKEIAVSISTDDGLNWSYVQTAATASQIGNPVPLVMADGTIALTFEYQTVGSDGVANGNGIVYSHDDGLTWSSPKDVSAGVGSEEAALLEKQGKTANLAKIGEVLYSSNPLATTGRTDLMVKRSTDNGQTWAEDGYLIQKDSSQGRSSLVSGKVGAERQGAVLYEQDSGNIDFKTFPLTF